jgi:hypothetical protein
MFVLFSWSLSFVIFVMCTYLSHKGTFPTFITRFHNSQNSFITMQIRKIRRSIIHSISISSFETVNNDCKRHHFVAKVGPRGFCVFHEVKSVTIQLLHTMTPVRIQVILNIPMCVVRGVWIRRSFGWDRVNRGPVSQQVWHDQNPSLLKGPERRA